MFTGRGSEGLWLEIGEILMMGKKSCRFGFEAN